MCEQDPLTLPFDLIVCGTSTIPSIVAAAACVAGKRVLHVDGTPFYGAFDATLPLSQLLPLLLSAPARLSGATLRCPSATPARCSRTLRPSTARRRPACRERRCCTRR